VLMVAAPAVTFLAIRHGSGATDGADTSIVRVEAPRGAVSLIPPGAAVVPGRVVSADLLPWLVEAWLVGVIFFSLRTAGGVLLVERLRLSEAEPVGTRRREVCLDLQRRLGLDRAIRYCECRRLEAPAVIGWFRPVVLLPVTALTGLSEQQLEAVIAHELAHVRRFDSLVNLFQVAAETLLFYHPAVWWVSRRVRAERENCCDDVAVSVCGDAGEYARTLVAMEEWRSAPSLAMAANRSPLRNRVARLLGAASGRAPGGGLGAVLLCLAGALLVGSTFLGVARASLGSGATPKDSGASDPDSASASPVPSAQPTPGVRPTPTTARPQVLIARASTPGPAQEPQAKGKDDAAATGEEQEGSSGKESFIDGLKVAGLENLTVDQLVAMKIQGVTPEYVRQVHELGLRPSADELIAMRVQGVTAEYVRDIRAQGLNPTAEQLVAMKTQGVTPEYVRGIKGLGLRADADELVGMQVQGVTLEYIRDMRAAGLNPTAEQFLAMKTQGATPEYVRGLHDLGLRPEADELVGMRVQGVTPDYIRQIRAAGLNPTAEQLVALRVQGVTPDYVRVLQGAGLGKLRVDDYLAAKVQGITPEFIEKARKHGFQNLDLDKLMALKRAGVL